ncbi:pseudouridine synthase [Acaricomes phytoseiuli]|uniref:pseudouridine synthase n=1 Tax=Acaricomes phytoseiuli TaxID=291968 RepID=UPI00037FE432|nr:pseudouridine synthase [Acaricomes phytoseiuli]
MESPLPVRHGVNATRLRLPADGPWQTILEYVLERFGHVDPEGIVSRFARGEVRGVGGTVIDAGTPLGEHAFLWYYRELPQEQPIPFQLQLLHRDEHLIVVDKPHFLPTTPGGRYLAESALIRLRRALDLPELVPIHRLDRMTAGVLLFAANPETRGKYQLLFERRQVHKQYEAIAPVRSDLGLPLTIATRMQKSRDYLLSRHLPGAPNTRTGIELVQRWASSGPGAEAEPGAELGLYRLTPYTGKTHQLRLHMAFLGLGIRNDPFYPVLLDESPDDYNRPLQLLARSLEFRDPISGREVQFRSGLKLMEQPELSKSPEPSADQQPPAALPAQST